MQPVNLPAFLQDVEEKLVLSSGTLKVRTKTRFLELQGSDVKCCNTMQSLFSFFPTKVTLLVPTEE